MCSEFRYEGNYNSIINVDVDAGEMHANNHNDDSNHNFEILQVINKAIEKTFNPNRLV